MALTHDEIVSRVVTVMQEKANPQDEGLTLVTDDRLRLNDYVSAAVGTAVTQVMALASGVNVVSIDANSDDSYVSYEGGSVKIGGKLRGRYVKLYRLKLNVWRRPASIGFAEDSEVAMCQYNPFTCAGPDKPVVVEHKSQEEVVLSCYPSGDGSSLEDLTVEVSYDPENGLNALDVRFEQAVVYMTAALVYQEMRMADVGSRMMDSALSVLGLTSVGQG